MFLKKSFFFAATALLCGLPWLAFAAEQAEHTKKAGLPQLDPAYFSPQIFWLLIVFFSLCIFMWFIGAPKIEKVLVARQERIKTDLDQATVLRDMTAAVIAKSEEGLSDARKKAKIEIAEALASASKSSSEYFKKTEEDLINKTKLAIAKLEVARDTAMQNLDKASIDITNALLEKIIGTNFSNTEITSAMSAIKKVKNG